METIDLGPLTSEQAIGDAIDSLKAVNETLRAEIEKNRRLEKEISAWRNYVQQFQQPLRHQSSTATPPPLLPPELVDHMEKMRNSMQLMDTWIEDSYTRVNSDEEKVVMNVVNRVLKELKKVRLDVAKHPVGLDEAEHDFHNISLQSAGPIQIVGIWGMGGAGKTTLAKHLYNKKCLNIGRSSFLSDVREAARKEVLHEKQKKLLEDLDIKGKGAFFDNVDQGKEILKSRLRSVPVLIVLDDVDHTDQLDTLLPERESLGQGSLIIVTTPFLLACIGQPSPLVEFKELAQKFINACHGLPLSLKVLGGLLYGESSKKYWESQLDKLSRIVPDDIKLRLKISYDALDKEEKEMFLDIACLFIGWRSSEAIAVWDGSE
ncbi:disease resistance protein RPV1-like [Cryptomeria japonica]|uniref:disease resistance protein RPV1-like n=1 Tax=Cryptomeria japonica TaxID=3369 RepID=UPI0027DA3022|nr:disease resistance protein RPV1-like [Cryptomeria japonica]